MFLEYLLEVMEEIGNLLVQTVSDLTGSLEVTAFGAGSEFIDIVENRLECVALDQDTGMVAWPRWGWMRRSTVQTHAALP